MKPYVVRPLSLADIPAVVEAARVIHRISVFAHMDFNGEKMARVLVLSLTHPDTVFAHVIVYDDQPVGLLLGSTAESFFGSDKVANDMVVFVLPAHQGRCVRSLQALLDAFQEWATARGAKIVQFGVSTQIEAERTAGLLDRLGFPQTGSLHAITIH